MRIRIDLKILIFLFVFFLTNQIEIYLIIMFFCLLHELGHIIMGIILKMKPEKIELMAFGLSSSFKANSKDGEIKIKNGNLLQLKEILIALAGPILSIVLVIIYMYLEPIYITREVAIYSNLLIMIFNLLPIYPLDGGRLLKAVLRNKYNFRETDKITNQITNIIVIGLTAVSSIIVLIYHNIGLLLLLLYIWILNIKENKKYILKTRVYNAIYSKDIDKNS